jgi:DNA polymerase III gamma/tau subunit
LKRQAALFSEPDLVRFFHSLAETETLLRTAAHPRYQLEVGLVKLMEMRRLEPVSQLMQRLGALEESVRTGKTLPEAKRAASTPSFSSAPATTGGSQATSSKSATEFGSAVAAGSFTGAATKPALETELRTASLEVATDRAVAGPAAKSESVAYVAANEPSADSSDIGRIKTLLEKRRKMFFVTALEGAREVSIRGNELYVEFAPEAKHLRDTLAKSDNIKILREVCKEITGADLGVRFVIADHEGANAPVSKEETERQEKQRLREKVEKDPTVQQMLRTFRGEIVDVRRVDGE